MDKFDRKTKDLERYLWATYSNICQPYIMTKTLENFPDTEMPTIVPNMDVERPEMDTEMTYLEKKKIDKSISQKPRNKDVYETDMHKIYNLVLDQKN